MTNQETIRRGGRPEFDIEKAIAHLQSIAILAVKAQDALRSGNSSECADLLNDIEDDIAKVRDNAPGLCW